MYLIISSYFEPSLSGSFSSLVWLSANGSITLRMAALMILKQCLWWTWIPLLLAALGHAHCGGAIPVLRQKMSLSTSVAYQFFYPAPWPPH
jgi:hypothetical protein